MADLSEPDIEEITLVSEVRPAFAEFDPAGTSDRCAAVQKGAPSPEENARSSRSRSSKQPRPIPVVIIEGSALFREGLAQIFAETPFQVTASAPSLEDLSESVFNDERCLALISLTEDADTVLAQASSLAQRGIRVILLGKQLQPDEGFAAIAVGADGYLLQNETGRDALLKAMELVWLGGVVIPKSLAKLLKDRAQLRGQMRLASDTAPIGDGGQLSDREQMILKQLTHGASNKHIAHELNITDATVKVHVKNLLRKIGATNRTQAAMWAMANGHSVNGFSHEPAPPS